MSRERIGSLIHNARNRLTVIMDRLGETETAAVQAAVGQLASALALLRLEDPETSVRREEVDLELFFSDLMGEVACLAPRHLTTSGAGDFSASPFNNCWTFDSQLVRLVVVDALANAWRHARREVRLTASCHDGELHFVVQDDGPGFPAAWLDGATATPQPRGTGHGLDLARHVAGMHESGGRRGHVRLAKGDLGGAAFSLILP